MKTQRIDLYLPAETKARIEHAAAIASVTTSEFVVSAARAAAERIVRDYDAVLAMRNHTRTLQEQ